MTADRVYWHVTTRPHAPRRAWHAQIDDRDEVIASCGFVASRRAVERSDRLPPTAHLCGSCARIIAAQTDIEDTSYGVTVTS